MAVAIYWNIPSVFNVNHSKGIGLIKTFFVLTSIGLNAIKFCPYQSRDTDIADITFNIGYPTWVQLNNYLSVYFKSAFDFCLDTNFLSHS